jgi:outer membrane protein OmpA-like peptidoglycan-associated protein
MEALLLANLSASNDDIRNLALQRAVVVKEYLAEKKVASERLFLGASKTSGDAIQAKPQAELEIGGS